MKNTVLAWGSTILLSATAALAHDPGRDQRAQYVAQQKWLIAQGVAEAQLTATAPHINALIYAQSPYLLSHALQPVHWRQWSEGLFSAEQQQLVFISIGYSTCHWCHVMARESFADESVAEVLSNDFVSVKVDREQHPGVDAIYRNALEKLQGEAGWPINVVTTPRGDVVWIDSYQTKTELLETLQRLALHWRSNADSMRRAASNFNSLLNTPASESDIPPGPKKTRKLLSATAQQLQQFLQREGSIEKPVFPRGHWLQLLLLEARLSGDESLLQAVEQRFARIMLSPTWDTVDGGLHRYSETADWQSPHFEKMLYDQAQWLSLCAQLYLQTGDDKYLRLANFIHLWVTRFLQLGEGYASALSAVSSAGEGSYYLFSPQQLPASVAMKSGPYLGRKDQLLLRGSLKELQRLDLQDIRDRRPTPYRDDKIIVSWNAMYLLSLLDLYLVSGEQPLLERVLAGAEFLWQNAWDEQSGQLQRIIFQGRASTEATFEDYAWLSYLLAAIARLTNSEELLQRAQTLDLHMAGSEPGGDQEMASPMAAMLAMRAALASATGEKKYRQLELQSFYTEESLSARTGTLLGLHEYHRLAPLKGAAWFANGKGWVRARYDAAANEIKLRIALQPPWHINANPAGEGLLPTEIQVEGAETVSLFPQPELVTMEFVDQPIPLYSGEFSITVRLDRPIYPVQLQLKLQACSDRVCLLPEILSLLPVPR